MNGSPILENFIFKNILLKLFNKKFMALKCRKNTAISKNG
uniref:Uncharacterized protein n=1 Tax=Promethearchaeum syntrophicum TaxID=2594042 RepID=A0A5B9DCX4_9ARCH|nr:hypothetical protein DSAG12_02453 [Candidatus Prometheoarchaeum syntrophicum]